MHYDIRERIPDRCPPPPWLRRLGPAGYLLLLIRGLLWLSVPGLLIYLALD
jgi:hypothetical protein